MAAPENLVIAGLPNHAFADVATITAGADAGGDLGKDNLKTPEPWEVARLDSVFPHESYWECAWSSAVSLQAFGLVNHSLIPGDQVRVVGVASGALPAVRSETLPPTAIEASVNTAGVVADIDEHPSAATGADSISAINASLPWSVRVSFGTPAAAPATGDDYQCFAITVAASGAPSQGDDHNRVTATLYENGVEVADLGTKTIVFAAGWHGLLFPWDAAALGTPDGSEVELLLEFTGEEGFAKGQLDAVSWEVLSTTDAAAPDFDTGWETIGGAETEAAWGNTALQEVDLPQPIWHYIPAAAQSLLSIRVEFRADGSGFFTDFILTPPRTPSGFVDVGVLVAGPAFEMFFNFAPGGSLRSAPTLVGDEEGITGSNRAIAAYRRRTCDVLLELLPESTAHSLFARLDGAAMGVTAFLLLLEPMATGTIARNTTFWAIVAESRGLVYAEGFSDGGEPLRSMGYLIEEKL